MQVKPGSNMEGGSTQAQRDDGSPPILHFPQGFLWGVATSHFQVEGNQQEIRGRLSDWAGWTAINGKILDRSTADRACDFVTRYEEDIDLCKALNLNAFRLSFNWPALMPDAGQTGFDRQTADFYKRLLYRLKEDDFKVFATLFHFCLPSWIATTGGWNNRKTIAEFERFTEIAVREFGEYVDFWLTVNEPLAYSYQGYIEGAWPPGLHGDYIAAFGAIRNMLEGHARSYAAIKEKLPDSKVSFTMHWIPFQAHNKLSPLDNLARFMRAEVFNQIWMRAVETGNLQFPPPLFFDKRVRRLAGTIPELRGTLDYLAINYYTRQVCEYDWGNWPPDIFGRRSDLTEYETSALGWEVYPEGLYDLLTSDLDPFRYDDSGHAREIYITENGFSSMFSSELTEGDWSLNDELRMQYLISHVGAMHKAIADGANVKGYLHWSLLDNFEWAEGLRARFGLVRVAFPTLERTLRESAKIYADIAGRNALVRPPNFTFRQPR
jgi:beta-glucosidase